MSHLKIKDAREKSKDELVKLLKEAKNELSQLRVAKQSNAAASKVGKIRVIRKNIARVLTVLSQNERDNLKKFYNSKRSSRKIMPKSLRPKLTKARRQALTKKEKSRKTRKATKKASRFPARSYAVKI